MRTKKYDMGPLLPYAMTTFQRQALEAIEETQNAEEAARRLNTTAPNIYRVIRITKKRAAKMGWSPDHDMTRTVPDGYRIKGTSSLYIEGDLRAQWVKTEKDAEAQQEMAREMVEAICADIRPLDPLSPPTTDCDANLLNLYTLTDTHIGMLAWGVESGKDWNLEIAEAVITACFADLIRRAPKSATAVVAQLGDWMHYDGLQALTPTSKHILDASGRPGQMVAVATRIMRKVIDMALAHHGRVHLLIAEGNHDMFGSLMMRTMFAALYENEPRLTMIESENPYYALQFGKNMLAWHHGHKRGLTAETALLIASSYREIFGSTEYRVLHFGDKHHRQVKELAGMMMEQHGTLAANDAYATRGGWKSHQYAEVITYHIDMGEVGRVRSTPAMVGL